ncbi:hypothetical protein [Nonomuraea sp. NPDC048916]|uniref:hypothetical protein n=1 Tax=Nonomuraea sp. NPDC048916 TaxID=3154232 RepID=UPI0033DEAF18
MPAFSYATDLADELAAMAGDVPAAIDVVRLAPPDPGTVRRRLRALVETVAALGGDPAERPEVIDHPDRTTMRLPGRLRATGFHASSAMTVQLDVAPGEDPFRDDPGDDELTGLLRRAGERLGLASLVPADDRLAFERLWRIGDRPGRTSEPVLCRAVGAFRHFVREIPVYGRASATVELAEGGRLSSLSLSARRFADDGGGTTVATPEVRRPRVAAREVAARVVESFGGPAELPGTILVPQWFRWGYLSLGRRRAQALLAPFYLASLTIRREHETSAHLVAVPATDERFVHLPSGRRPAPRSRQPA